MLWICFFFALLRLLTASGNDFEWVLQLTAPLHTACVDHFQNRGYNEIYLGLICGESALSPRETALFKETGLYHLLVVSGSHFIFLGQILNGICKKRTKTKFAIFVFFAAVCQFNPPVMRALVSLILSALSKKYRLFWRPEQVALYSGLGCLVLFPEWLLSLSLLLSWLASLALTFSRRNGIQHICIFFAILPVFYNSTFWSVMNNLLLTPLFGMLYFPFTVATAALPYGSIPGNWVWEITFKIMPLLPSAAGAVVAPSTLVYLWLYTFGLQLLKRLQREVEIL
jgi:predicted membrane metal-binding protein